MSILGDGLVEPLGLAIDVGLPLPRSVRGTAPKARLVMQSLDYRIPGQVNPIFSVPPAADLGSLFLPLYRDFDACAVNNSWGPTWDHKLQPDVSQQIACGDDHRAQACDKFVRKYWDHVIVFAAGNNGLFDSVTGAHIGSAAAAKNVITLGLHTPAGHPGTPTWYGLHLRVQRLDKKTH